jgi:hypothetical protein
MSGRAGFGLLSVVLVALLVAPQTALSQAVVGDSVTATGSSVRVFAGDFSLTPRNIDIHATSGPAGENATGQASFDLARPGQPNSLPRVSGPVTCLNVAPDGFPGQFQAPSALINVAFETELGPAFLIYVSDRGGPSTNDGSLETADFIDVSPAGSIGDCSVRVPGPFFGHMDSGDIVVRDAPPLPSSKDQCKNGGWRKYPGFKNQGDCVSFVTTNGTNPQAGAKP